MRKTLLAVSAVLLCCSTRGWTSEKKEAWISRCVQGSTSAGRGSCECTLERVVIPYFTPDQLAAQTKEELARHVLTVREVCTEPFSNVTFKEWTRSAANVVVNNCVDGDSREVPRCKCMFRAMAAKLSEAMLAELGRRNVDFLDVTPGLRDDVAQCDKWFAKN